MASRERGRADLTGRTTRPPFERLGRRLNPESRRTSASLQAAIRQINRRFGSGTVGWAVDLNGGRR
jgi:hypothetical protein